jgi:hypothetical protein
MHSRAHSFCLVKDAPPDDAYLSRVSESSTLSWDDVFLVSAMNKIVTGLAERDQIIWAIPACFAGFDVVDV